MWGFAERGREEKCQVLTEFFIWSFVATPGILTPAGAPSTAFGSGLFVGDSTNSNGAHFIYNVNTPTSFGAANRVGQCYRLDTSAGPSTSGETSGNPTSPYTYIGSCASFSQNSKGSNFATDVLRKGTGFYVFLLKVRTYSFAIPNLGTKLWLNLCHISPHNLHQSHLMILNH